MNKLYKTDAVQGAGNGINEGKELEIFNLKEVVKVCETEAERVKGFVYLVSGLVELDKNYTQELADNLVLINDKSSSVKDSLEDLVSTLRTLEDGKVSNIVSKTRKTIDGRDNLMMSIYQISKNCLNNYSDSSLPNDQYLSKKTAITDISNFLKTIGKSLRIHNDQKFPNVDKKILESENLQRISKDIC